MPAADRQGREAKPREWGTYTEFYQGSGYAQFPQEHRRSRGRLPFSMFIVEQGPHNFRDPAVPETVIALPLAVEGICNWSWWIGDERITREAEPGRMLVVPSDFDSRWEVDGRRRLLALVIPNDTVRQVLGPDCPAHLQSAFWKLAMDTWADPLVEVLLKHLWEYCGDEDIASKYLADGLLTSIIAQMLIHAENHLDEGRKIALPRWRLNKVKDFILAHMGEDITLEHMAAAANLSRRHFARCFFLEIGQTPYRWLLEQRLDRAKDLLASTEDSLSDISAACGFSSQSHLTTLLRKQTNLTPSAWRKKFRQ